jgi:aspartyl-tRNA(Asn)/glutamyl-tRNA(Gln) amidotransferase subunit A
MAVVVRAAPQGEDDAMTLDASGLCRLPIAELLQRFRRRELSPVEVAEAALDRIDALNPTLNAFCTIKPELVRAQARRAEQQLRSGDTAGPLCGVPIAVKDLIFTRDLRTVGGSTAYRDFVPEEDDITVERLRNAGAVILGKTNVPEFGYGRGLTINPVFGVTRNPWNLERTPGSSSGGSAAALAAGMCPGALGSDGGGSVRSPSSYCGLYGLKASFGRVPLYPGCRDVRYPGFSGWETLEHIGPMARTVTDVALMLDVLAGPDPRDRHSLPREAGSFANLDGADVKGLRIAWTVDFGGYARADAPVAAAVEAAARQFADLGARVENATPFTDDPGGAFAAAVALDSDVTAMRKLAAEQPDAISDALKAAVAREWTYAELSDAATARRDLYNKLWRFFETYDLLLTPTTPTAAFDVTHFGPREVAGVPVTPDRPVPSFTSPFNLTGSPAASIPVGWTDDGLPIGMQIVGNHLADALVLKASRAYEIAAPWADRWPTL